MNIGQRIKKARKEACLSQKKLAGLCGIRNQLLNDYERGKVKNIPLNILQTIAEILKKPIGWFFGEEEISPAASLLDEIIKPPHTALTSRQVEALASFFAEFKKDTVVRDAIPSASIVTLLPKQREAALREYIIEAQIHRLPQLEVSKKAAAGAGDFIDVPTERLILSQHRWRKGYTPFKIVGDSMAPYIMDGDYVVVDVKRDPKNGDVVIARTDDGLTVKKYFLKHDHVELVSVNPEYEPVKLTDVAILGIIIDIVRPVKKII
ncbi:MAG: S24 family peptidase [bacterium]